MEDANMSQSAEQTAIGSVPPGGQGGNKRQVSADAFRALTQRLNNKASTAPVLPAASPVNHEPTPPIVTNPINTPEFVAPSPPVSEPDPVLADAAQSASQVAQPPTREAAQVQNEVLQSVTSDLPETGEIAPIMQNVPQQNSDPVVGQMPSTPMSVGNVSEEGTQPDHVAVVQPEPTPAPQPVPEPTLDAILQPVQEVASPASLAPEVAAPQPSQPQPDVVPAQFAMPASGTKIILNATPRTHSAIPKPLEKPVTAPPPEAIKPGDVGEIPARMVAAEPEREAVAVSIDPLQAAMNLMNATNAASTPIELAVPPTPSMTVETAPSVEVPSIPVQTPLCETAAEALSQEFQVPTIDAPINTLTDEGPAVAPAPSETVAPTIETIAPVDTDVPTKEPASATRPPVVENRVETTNNVAPSSVQPPPVIGESVENTLDLEPDAQSGETARALLDIMSSGSQPQERALAADTLLQLIPRMMIKDLVALSERVCMMEDAPPLLVKALINHREGKVASPLLMDGKVIVEQDLLRLIATTDVDRLIMMAKHRQITQTVCDALIARGEPSVYLTLVRNPGASLSHDAFVAFNEIAKSQPSLQAPLATRGDTPPPIAFELFWSLPVELRRYVLSRFLTDSATLDKILKITQSVDGGDSKEQKFPPARKVEELIDAIADGVTDHAVDLMAELASTNKDNARRIIADPDGEPLTVVLKSMGQTRAQFSQSIKKCASSSKAMLRGDRDLAELQIMFDSLSFNKARTLLTYWDWAIEKTGPYSRRVM